MRERRGPSGRGPSGTRERGRTAAPSVERACNLGEARLVLADELDGLAAELPRVRVALAREAEDLLALGLELEVEPDVDALVARRAVEEEARRDLGQGEARHADHARDGVRGEVGRVLLAGEALLEQGVLGLVVGEEGDADREAVAVVVEHLGGRAVGGVAEEEDLGPGRVLDVEREGRLLDEALVLRVDLGDGRLQRIVARLLLPLLDERAVVLELETCVQRGVRASASAPSVTGPRGRRKRGEEDAPLRTLACTTTSVRPTRQPLLFE